MVIKIDQTKFTMVEFIMYHYVRDIKSSMFPNIKGLDYKDFLEQIKFLKKEYTILSIEDFLNSEYNKNTKNCVLTFDDGYIDHYEFVFPILLKNNIKGSFFSPVDTIEKNIMIDVNLIHLILSSGDENKILKRLIFHYNRMNNNTDTIENYISSIQTKSRYDTETTIIIKRLLQKKLPLKMRSKICRLLLEDFVGETEQTLSKSFYLSRKNIEEMISNGMHFGSHGKSHFWFSSLNRRDQEIEIKDSIKFLSSLYNKYFDLTMCYPYGDFNETTLSLLKEYNFKLALTTVPETYIKEKYTMFEIPRWDTNDYYPKKI